MSYMCDEDGTVSLGRDEHYDVSGEVLIKVYVSFSTDAEPGEDRFESDMYDAIREDVGLDFEIEDYGGVDIEIWSN